MFQYHIKTKYSVYYTNQMYIISYVEMLKKQFQHVWVQVYNLQGTPKHVGDASLIFIYY